MESRLKHRSLQPVNNSISSFVLNLKRIHNYIRNRLPMWLLQLPGGTGWQHLSRKKETFRTSNKGTALWDKGFVMLACSRPSSCGCLGSCSLESESSGSRQVDKDYHRNFLVQ
ncbi:uncharacterized protein Dana_GF27726, isoform A [Drosophila ananassae]|uniref:Uncharacterized protein, isoform A n=1 Tax=Drosophila ananassae TaxID=7217 RepID=A0A0P9AN24_DROAN|nr:uncharacterized protein Dana_GF27726, isoform A [Drosophila ananassae]